MVWLILGADRPEQSRFVSAYELSVLKESVSNSRNEKPPNEFSVDSCQCSNPEKRQQCPANKFERVPVWSRLFKCPTLLASVVAYFAFHWNMKAASMWPTYFANILHLDASLIGTITGIKGILCLIYGVWFGYITRNLSIRRPFNMSLTSYRHTCQIISTLVLAISLTLLTTLDCELPATIVSILLTPIVGGFNTISILQLPLDLSPEDSGLIYSYVHMLGIGQIIALPVSSYILSFAPESSVGDRFTWRMVWLLGLGFKVFACAIFVRFAKAEPKSYSRLRPMGACKSRDEGGQTKGHYYQETEGVSLLRQKDSDWN